MKIVGLEQEDWDNIVSLLTDMVNGDDTTMEGQDVAASIRQAIVDQVYPSDKISLSVIAKIAAASSRGGGSMEEAFELGQALKAATALLPAGNGLNGKREFLLDLCNDHEVVVFVGFHHMRGKNKKFDYWTYHRIFVRSTFSGEIQIEVKGQNDLGVKQEIKERFKDTFTL